MRFTKSDYEKLIRRSFLSFAKDEEIRELVNLGRVVESEALQRVPREEQPLSFFLILSGEVTLRHRGTFFEMDRLGYGHSLELRSLLLHVPQWQYEWQCETKTFLLKLPWKAIELILQKYPSQLQYLARITQSVALQRLKRDLLGLNVSWSTVIDLISRMKQLKFSDLRSIETSSQMLVTLLSGEIVVQVDEGERPFHLMTLSAGDTTLIDWEKTHLKYVPQNQPWVWVVSEKDWQSLSDKPDFKNILELFKKKNFRETVSSIPEDSHFFQNHRPSGSTNQTTALPLLTEVPETNYFHYLWWKINRPSLLASVDEGRTGTAILVFLLKQAGLTVHHRDIDAKVPDEWNDTTFSAFQAKCTKVGVTTELRDFPSKEAIPSQRFVVIQTKTGFNLIFSKRKDYWTLADFNSGTYRDIPYDELPSELKVRKCLVVKKVTNVFPPPSQEFKLHHLLHFLKADPSVLGFLFLGSFLGFVADLSLPVFSQYLLDQVVTSGRVALLNPLILVFVTLTVLGVFISWFNQTHNTYLVNVIALRMKSLFQASLFKLNPLVLHSMGASQLMSRISDIDQLANFLVYQCFGSVLSILFMLGNLSVLWIYSPKIVALVFLLLPFGVLITFLMKSKIENLKLVQVRTKARENRLIFEHFSSNDDMRTVKGVLPSRWKWDFNASLFARNLISNQKLQAVFSIIQLTGSEGVKMASFFFALHLYVNHQLTLGQVIAVVMIVPRVTEPIQGLVSTIYHYFNNKIIMARLNDLLSNAPSEDPAKYIPTEMNHFLRFDKVFFRYETESKHSTLKDITLEIRHGQKVAFVGNMGSGKSALSYLMAGLYEPTQGSIHYDGVKKSQIDPQLFYSKVAMVEQEGRLFSGTILDNIALGEEHPDLERAVRCAKAVVMDDDILARPGGYGSMLMHGGVGLSEGQRQRLLIARALYRNPQILILDEATSFLDPISENQVIKNIWEMMNDRTVIFFTQRIQITSRVDKVFFLENGQLLEQGSHKELIESREKYFNFYLRHLSIG